MIKGKKLDMYIHIVFVTCFKYLTLFFYKKIIFI